MNVLSAIVFVAHCIGTIGLAIIVVLMFVYSILVVCQELKGMKLQRLTVPGFVIRGAKFEPDGTLYSAYGYAENIEKAYISVETNERFNVGGVPCFLVSIDTRGNVEFRPVRYFKLTGER